MVGGIEPFAVPGFDSMAEVQPVPVDDDGGEQVEASYPVMLPLRRAVADFALTADAEGIFQRMMCLAFVEAQEQPHAHVMLTMRDLTGEGFGNKNRDWNAAKQLEGWRSAWADHANQALERAGCDERKDMAQGLRDRLSAACGSQDQADDRGMAERIVEATAQRVERDNGTPEPGSAADRIASRIGSKGGGRITTRPSVILNGISTRNKDRGRER